MNVISNCHHRVLKLVAMSLFATLLTACGSSGTGVGETSTPQSGSNEVKTPSPLEVYNNQNNPPTPNDHDVEMFMNEFWNNVAATDRCGQCHHDGHDTPFARTDNINTAYNATTPLINRLAPQTSQIVTKVAGGHQCWESNDDACAKQLTRWIQRWLGEGDGTGVGSTTIVLEKPVERSLTGTKILPSDVNDVDFTDLHGLLTQYCSDCHSESAATPQQPYFASSNAASAWDAVRSKIDLEDENRLLDLAQSRLIVRLRSEFHNCWSDCEENATAMHSEIIDLAEGIAVQEVDPGLRTSSGVILNEGTVASSGGRYEQYQIAFWDFSEGDGRQAFDTSGVEPAMHLSLSGDINWVGGWGINITEGRAWADTASSVKLYDSIATLGEYSVEAWVAPNNVTQEEAHIMTYSNSAEERNFTIGQTLYSYDFFQKTNQDLEGDNNLSTDADAELLQATLQHIVITYDRENGRRIYVNGEYTNDIDDVDPGLLTNWDDGLVFSIGNEPDGNNQWQGMVRMAAIHNRALTADQVTQNYNVGVGEKFYLLFDVTNLVTINDCYDSYIVFEAAQLDNYAYRFNNPFFARLYEQRTSGSECRDSTPPAQASYNFNVTDIRIGINGEVAQTGQAFRNVGRGPTGDDIGFTIDSASNADGYQQIADIGTIIAIENGPTEDLFFLAFGNINSLSGATSDPAAIEVSIPADSDPMPDYGLRTFDEVNASMSNMTGIPVTNTNVTTVFNNVKTQLPTSEVAETFLAAHQIAVAQMAITYCSELVDQEVLLSPASRTFFTNVDFNATPAIVFADDAAKDLVFDPIINFTIGNNLADQPTAAEVKANFNILLNGNTGSGLLRTGLLDCGSDCDATRTQTIVKSLCAASLGSATMLIQ